MDSSGAAFPIPDSIYQDAHRAAMEASSKAYDEAWHEYLKIYRKLEADAMSDAMIKEGAESSKGEGSKP